ncbi:TPA: hypothetical protein OMQ61_002336 [Acinetobacter baumannii]|nr:hypothetical protein [Acinetobacter baumannii]
MKPEQFIREFGEKKAREVVSTGSDTYVFKPKGKKKYVQLSIADLKRLVESLDLVRQEGGTEGARDWAFRIWKSNPNDPHIERLKQAIRDYESIYGGGDE